MMKRTGGGRRKAEQTEERMKGERGLGVQEKKKSGAAQLLSLSISRPIIQLFIKSN